MKNLFIKQFAYTALSLSTMTGFAIASDDNDIDKDNYKIKSVKSLNKRPRADVNEENILDSNNNSSSEPSTPVKDRKVTTPRAPIKRHQPAAIYDAPLDGAHPLEENFPSQAFISNEFERLGPSLENNKQTLAALEQKYTKLTRKHFGKSYADAETIASAQNRISAYLNNKLRIIKPHPAELKSPTLSVTEAIFAQNNPIIRQGQAESLAKLQMKLWVYNFIIQQHFQECNENMSTLGVFHKKYMAAHEEFNNSITLIEKYLTHGQKTWQDAYKSWPHNKGTQDARVIALQAYWQHIEKSFINRIVSSLNQLRKTYVTYLASTGTSEDDICHNLLKLTGESYDPAPTNLLMRMESQDNLRDFLYFQSMSDKVRVNLNSLNNVHALCNQITIFLNENYADTPQVPFIREHFKNNVITFTKDAAVAFWNNMNDILSAHQEHIDDNVYNTGPLLELAENMAFLGEYTFIIFKIMYLSISSPNLDMELLIRSAECCHIWQNMLTNFKAEHLPKTTIPKMKSGLTDRWNLK